MTPSLPRVPSPRSVAEEATSPAAAAPQATSSEAPLPPPESAAPPGSRAARLRHPVRIVTAASLFDGHDAAINIMRRILQASGAEVIHLGHDRSVAEIVDCAIQEDAQGIALTSYQGGHVEYLKYMVDLLRQRGAHIGIYGGGGGTILPSEIAELQAYGVRRLFSPDDGRALGLQGMIDEVLEDCDWVPPALAPGEALERGLDRRDPATLARLISMAEAQREAWAAVAPVVRARADARAVPVLGVTGTGGAGKSSLVDELLRRFLVEFPDKTAAILSVDPTRRRSGGALLGDRIRMNALGTPRVFMRSMATRRSNSALSAHVRDAVEICKSAGFDLVIVETSGIGQADTEITELGGVTLYVMTADYGAATQLEKIDMLDFADLIAVNKFDKAGSLDALRDVRKQLRRNRALWSAADDDLPVFGTIASQFGDEGTDALYRAVMNRLAERLGAPLASHAPRGRVASETRSLLPGERVRYLAEIADASVAYDERARRQSETARRLGHLAGALDELRRQATDPCDRRRAERSPLAPLTLPAEDAEGAPDPGKAALVAAYRALERDLTPEARALLESWPGVEAEYRRDRYGFRVRDRVVEADLYSETLAHTRVPKVALPRFRDWGELLAWLQRENLPGFFPYTAGVFPLKREGEDPTRMFAGEGGPERTNRRFHYVSRGLPARRLSTAFDSVTLYGEDPDPRPDIYGKIGNSGVSVATVDDAKRLYSGFDLADPQTSVSMTINGPAPMVLAFFLNAAIDQQCERYLREQGKVASAEARIAELYAERSLPRPTYDGELPAGNDGLGLLLLGVSGEAVLPPEVYARIKAHTLKSVRGTVQADILKEDQAQNTCVFSTEFALRMMGDIQEYFITHEIRNFYSVSISGYHIAEAGANPITQLAFTLANGFTYVEYYLARGMAIDDFAPNFSFFFSNGLDAEYSVIGRVARRLWAKAMRDRYGANERSQKLKYHVQTSGRSLHAQEIAFNDIRTTLQALYALNDNCNSLHTNAYDEAITTPTEESVRRALAIQLIINRELGLSKNENSLQGSFVIEELTDLVEQAVLAEFRRLSERGGVLGAMERMYQRSRIQDESLRYESLKHSGAMPIIGVNTFLGPDGSPTVLPREVIRSTPEERDRAIASRLAFEQRNAAVAPDRLRALQQAALAGGNTFDAMMEAAKVCTLGQLSRSLYEVGGRYRRSM